MSEPVKGIVTFEKKVLKISWMGKNGMAVPNVLAAGVARSRKVAAYTQAGNLDVLVELVGGRPVRVWCPDEEPPAMSAVAPASAGGNGNGRLREQRYHNPYNFIPAIPRNALPAESELADHIFTAHDKLDPQRWTGRLHVRMATETPLLIPDLPIDPNAEHKVYPIRVDAEGRPLLAATSVKGMLRSAYEAVTNSRMGVFAGHDVPLGMRRESHTGLDMVPVRIVAGAGGGLQAELYLGTTEIDPTGQGRPKGDMMYAAWLPSYHFSTDGVSNISRWKHGDYVERFLAVAVPHERGAKFSYWRVVPDNYKGPEKPTEFHGGWVCISGRNMPPGKKKHDERIFFNAGGRTPTRIAVTDVQQLRWKNLIDNYYQANERDIRNGAVCPPALGRDCEYSRHIREWETERELKEGTLCYASVRWNDRSLELVGLFPVMISRDLQGAAPDELLDASVRPAPDIKHLSPADRVFGWVKDGVSGSDELSAYRGNLRVGSVHCETSDAIVSLSRSDLQGLPLAIMGQPKPEQARFYAAADQLGTAQRNGISKQAALYAPGKGLRGRKVYPHQNVPEGYWSNPTEDRTQTEMTGAAGWYQEYRRPQVDGKQQDTQNRTVQAWVRPGSVFSFDLDVTNLSSVELGALLWILSLGPRRYLKIGSGKAYGFGSVALSVDWQGCELGKGSDWAAYYASLTSVPPAPSPQCGAELVREYQEAVATAGRAPFEQVRFIRAFIVAAEGYADGLPTHYPRTRKKDDPGTVPPNPAGEGFRWFSENERSSKDHDLKGLALPDLATDQGLPYLEEYEKTQSH